MTMKDYVLVEKNGKLDVFRINFIGPKSIGLFPQREKLESNGYKVIKKVKEPTVKVMEKWLDNGIAKAVDGCSVEPDGVCQHGAASWLIKLGLI